jgi:hypothetical protein
MFMIVCILKNSIFLWKNIRILDVVRLVHGYNEQKMVQQICNRPSEIHCLNSDWTGDLYLLRYKPANSTAYCI